MHLPLHGRLIGLDFGTVRIGLAITDPEQRLASPLENYTRRDARQDEAHFRRLAEQEAVVGFVVGLPVHGSGEESRLSQAARQFGQWLGERTGLPVVYFDERYTSLQAKQLLLESGMSRKRRKQRLDMLAAQVMLSHFVESRARSREPAAGDPGDLSDRPPGPLED